MLNKKAANLITTMANPPVLQAGDGMPGVRYLQATPETVLWGEVPCREDHAVAELSPGESITVDTVSHEGMMPDQGGDPLAFFGSHGVEPGQVLRDAIEICAAVTRMPSAGPHIITGPIAVRGAEPGDLLAIRMDNFDMRTPYGVMSTRHGRGVLSGQPLVEGTYSEFCPVRSAASGSFASLIGKDGKEIAAFPLSPFLGIVGVATDTAQRQSSIPPGKHGGNVDIKLLTKGSTLFLPIQVPGAMFYVGDPHYAQGNGEVSLTALEAPLRAHLTVDLIKGHEVAQELSTVKGPFAAGNGLLIPTGMDEDLDEALKLCVSDGVELLVSIFGISRRQAYLYLGAAADFQISQAVDVVKGVHGEVRVRDFSTARTSEVAQRLLERAQ